MFGPGWDESAENASPLAPGGKCSGMEGLVPRIASSLFGEIEQKCSKSTKLDINVYVTIIEIYNETIRDLLKGSSASGDPKPKTLKLRESKSRGVYIDGIERRKIISAASLLDAIREGGASRAVASTKMNDRSSRSHVIVGIHVVQQTEEGDGLCSTTRSKISLVDLAGSERVGKTSASGQTLKEAQSINQSLSALGNCMRALTQPASIPKKKSLQHSVLSKGRQISSSQVRHIPYRDSKLTHLLKSSLGGNAKTTLIIAVASDMENLEETVSTLRFGIRAKRIKNNAIANKSMTLQELHMKMQALRGQVEMLSNETAASSRSLLLGSRLQGNKATV